MLNTQSVLSNVACAAHATDDAIHRCQLPYLRGCTQDPASVYVSTECIMRKSNNHAGTLNHIIKIIFQTQFTIVALTNSSTLYIGKRMILGLFALLRVCLQQQWPVRQTSMSRTLIKRKSICRDQYNVSQIIWIFGPDVLYRSVYTHSRDLSWQRILSFLFMLTTKTRPW